jgi:hypothetical protein
MRHPAYLSFAVAIGALLAGQQACYEASTSGIGGGYTTSAHGGAWSTSGNGGAVDHASGGGGSISSGNGGGGAAELGEPTAVVVPYILAPTHMLVRVRAPGATCTDPGSGMAAPSTPQLDLELPPNMQTPGTYALAEVGWYNTGGFPSPAKCGISGTVEVTSVDATQISFAVTNAAACGLPYLDLGQLDGTYTALRCANTVPSAIATPDTDATGVLVLRVAAPGITCGPSATHDAYGSHANLEIKLPPESQVVGTHVLGDGVVSRTGWACPPGAYWGCDGGGSTCTAATVEITSIDASQVTFTVSALDCGPYVSANSMPDLEGTFTAPRCN